jgi:hypothetical protein
MCAVYGWDDPIAIVNDFEADLQQALRNHEQAGRAGALKIFQEEVNWMRQRTQELRLALGWLQLHSQKVVMRFISLSQAPTNTCTHYR